MSNDFKQHLNDAEQLELAARVAMRNATALKLVLDRLRRNTPDKRINGVLLMGQGNQLTLVRQNVAEVERLLTDIDAQEGEQIPYRTQLVDKARKALIDAEAYAKEIETILETAEKSVGNSLPGPQTV